MKCFLVMSLGLLFTSWMVQVIAAINSHKVDTLIEKSKFHHRELKRSIDDLQEALKSHEIPFCSVRSLLNEKDINLSINSLFTICPSSENTTQEKMDPNEATTTHNEISDNFQDGIVLSSVPYHANSVSDAKGGEKSNDWDLPNVLPIRVQAERIGSKVKVIFDVVHSIPAIVARVFTFDDASVEINIPNGDQQDGPLLSRVQFMINASACTSQYMDVISAFAFTPKEYNIYFILTTTYAYVDTCGFDKFRNRSFPISDKMWQKKQGSQLQDMRKIYPKIKFTLLNDGLRLKLLVDDNYQFGVSKYIMNYTNGEARSEKSSFTIHNGSLIEEQQERTGQSGEQMFNVELEEERDFPSGIEGENNSGNLTLATVKVTMTTEHGPHSGSATVATWYILDDYGSRDIVRYLFTDYTIYINQTTMPNGYSKPEVIVKSSQCTEEGVLGESHKENTINCLIDCQSYGLAITNISITKTGHDLQPLKQISNILINRAYSMIDVGPASTENNGTYQCVVETRNEERVVKSFVLFTSGMAAIDEANSGLESFKNGTTKVTCTATGMKPLDLQVDVRNEALEEKRIDNINNYTRIINDMDKGTELNLYLPTEHLKFPESILYCKVSNFAGHGVHPIFLYNEIDGYYDSQYPTLNTTVSKIVNFQNGTVAVTCSAAGAFPMDVWILYGGYGKPFRIDDDVDNNRSVTVTDNSKTVTVYVSTHKIDDGYSWMHCYVSNQYGTDLLDFNLRNYQL